MILVVVISPDDSEGVVLAKVMKAAKEIRPDDKKRVKTGVKTPIRRSGWGPGGCFPSLDAGRPQEEERRAWPMTAGQSPGGGNLRRMAGKKGDI